MKRCLLSACVQIATFSIAHVVASQLFNHMVAGYLVGSLYTGAYFITYFMVLKK